MPLAILPMPGPKEKPREANEGSADPWFGRTKGVAPWPPVLHRTPPSHLHPGEEGVATAGAE
jgi:hypothetical protein